MRERIHADRGRGNIGTEFVPGWEPPAPVECIGAIRTIEAERGEFRYWNGYAIPEEHIVEVCERCGDWWSATRWQEQEDGEPSMPEQLPLLLEARHDAA